MGAWLYCIGAGHGSGISMGDRVSLDVCAGGSCIEETDGGVG